jgi:DNA-binding transcriptional LysR family regulator
MGRRPERKGSVARTNARAQIVAGYTLTMPCQPTAQRYMRFDTSVPIRSRLWVNTSEAAVIAAIAGAGLTRVMSYKMDAARRAGTLEMVLEAFEPEPLPIHIVYSPRKPVPLKLRAFLDWVTPRLKARLAFGDNDR